MDKTKILITADKIYTNLGEFFSDPVISAMCQANPISGAISAYIGGSYNQEQFKTLENFLKLLEERIEKIEAKDIDKEFIQSSEGQRIIGKVFRSILRDNRQEKLQAMANLTSNIYTVFDRNGLTFDEKELYVDILDSLNVLQLSIIKKAIEVVKIRTGDPHKGFGWEILADHYKKKGITNALLLQSLSVLESSGLINKNTATIKEVDKTHYITAFAEQFYGFISDMANKDH